MRVVFAFCLCQLLSKKYLTDVTAVDTSDDATLFEAQRSMPCLGLGLVGLG